MALLKRLITAPARETWQQDVVLISGCLDPLRLFTQARRANQNSFLSQDDDIVRAAWRHAECGRNDRIRCCS